MPKKNTKVYKIISFFLLALLFSSCASKKEVAKTETVIETRTVVEKYIDTVFYTQKAETSFGIPISSIAKCPDLKEGFNPISRLLKPQVFTQKNGNAKATVKIIHDSIYVFAECDSLAIEAKIKSVYENKDRNREVLESKKEKKTTNVFTILGICAVCIIVGFGVGKLT